MRRTVSIVAALGIAAGLASCSSDGSTQDASAQYCAALNDLSGELAELGDLDASQASLDEFEAQAQEVARAADAVDEAGDDVDDALAQEFEQAAEQFDQAVDAIPGDATIEEAAQLYRQAAAELRDAAAATLSEVGC